MTSGNGSESKTRLESRFGNGSYKGYEIRLLVERTAQHEPYPLKTASDIYRFMADLSRESAEHVYELLMDAKNRVTGVYLVGKGCAYSSPVRVPEIFKAAYATNSPAFALVHNHPSGIVEPSPEDKSLVARVQSASDIMGMDFLDFVIIGDSRYYSFSENGLLHARRD